MAQAVVESLASQGIRFLWSSREIPDDKTKRELAHYLVYNLTQDQRFLMGHLWLLDVLTAKYYRQYSHADELAIQPIRPLSYM